MQEWKKPSVVIYEKSMITKAIKAKAYTVGQAMPIGEFCDQGVGASGAVQLPDGTVEMAYVAAFNAVDGIFTLIINGMKRFWNCLTEVFS